MKKQSIDIGQFRLIGGVTVEKVEGGNLVTFPPEGGRMILAGSPHDIGRRGLERRNAPDPGYDHAGGF